MTQNKKMKKPFFFKSYNVEGHPVVWDLQTMNRASRLKLKTQKLN